MVSSTSLRLGVACFLSGCIAAVLFFAQRTEASVGTESRRIVQDAGGAVAKEFAGQDAGLDTGPDAVLHRENGVQNSEALMDLCDLIAELAMDRAELFAGQSADCDSGAGGMPDKVAEKTECHREYYQRLSNLDRRYEPRLERLRARVKAELGSKKVGDNACCKVLPGRFHRFGATCRAVR